MRWRLRVLALISLVVFGLSLLLDASLYAKSPCPLGFLFKLYLVFVGVLGIPPALIGSVVAARLAAMRRQWGWLAGLLVASSAGVAFLYGAALDHPPRVVQAPLTALASAFDHVLGLTTCGSQSSHYVQAAALTLVLLVAPLALLSYSFSSAAGVPTGPSAAAPARTPGR
jgi:hypothetical protein